MTTPAPGTNRRSKVVVLAATVALLLSLLPGMAQAAPGGPTVGLASVNGDPTNSVIAVTATFSQAVTGFASGDIVSNGTVGVVSGGPTSYTFDVTAAGDGLVTISVPADVANATVGGLGNVAATPLTRTFDSTAPTVSSITRAASTPTNASSITFTVNFSEPVTGVTTGRFGLTTTGTVAGASVTGVSADGGSSRTVTVGTGTGDGTIRLDLTTPAGITRRSRERADRHVHRGPGLHHRQDPPDRDDRVPGHHGLVHERNLGAP